MFWWAITLNVLWTQVLPIVCIIGANLVNRNLFQIFNQFPVFSQGPVHLLDCKWLHNPPTILKDCYLWPILIICCSKILPPSNSLHSHATTLLYGLILAKIEFLIHLFLKLRKKYNNILLRTCYFIHLSGTNETAVQIY